jgi:hypothetical protein
MRSDDAVVRFPVRCPACHGEVIVEYRATDIIGALIHGRPIRLYAACHDKSWTPSYVEMQQIRAHIGATRPEWSNWAERSERSGNAMRSASDD